MNHYNVSLMKSVVRIAGCVFALMTGSVIDLAFAFIVAELLGIAEERV